ncbi:OmpA family protein [Solitalea sp. MAHUQ-68]|uniref:OmpA family protein n=1 Tax=Solitalea agri TaxID=2953739 RepID=A0A9X2JD51_9SPHI|nr:OmpA family protein [Solitalea agri]MCO4293753.1 OmpA family protein [Solitalea agri]
MSNSFLKRFYQLSFFLFCLLGVVSLFTSCSTKKASKSKTAQTYIKKYMDKEAFEIQRTVKDCKVERVGDSIKITFVNEVFFDFDQYSIKSDAVPTVNKLVNIIKKYAKTYNIIQGHTDDSGNEEYNLSLSFKRADEVKHFLVNNGISADRINAYGVGDTQPVASNDTENGRAKNRRVLIWITSDYGLKEEAVAKTQ